MECTWEYCRTEWGGSIKTTEENNGGRKVRRGTGENLT